MPRDYSWRQFWKRSGKWVVSLGLIAGFLPVVIWGVLAKPLNLITEAGEANQMRIWFEPGQISVPAGQTFTLKVIAESDKEENLIPEVKLSVVAPENGQILPTEIIYKKVFGGRTQIGEVNLLFNKPGRYQISLPEESVFTGLPNIKIITAPATVVAE